MKKQFMRQRQSLMLWTAVIIALGAFTFAGCSALSGNNPTATIRKYYSFADENKPEDMTKLFTGTYLTKNADALEKNRSFISFVRKDTPPDSKIVLSNLSEKIEGEIASVTGAYGLTGVSQTRPFEALLYRVNGEWKIESLTNK